MSLRLAVAFEAVVEDAHRPYRWRRAAREALQMVFNAGHALVLVPRRHPPPLQGMDADEEAADFYRTGRPPASVQAIWDSFDGMRDFLLREGAWGLFQEVWQGPGPPDADLVVDPAAERPNWVNLARQLGLQEAGT